MGFDGIEQCNWHLAGWNGGSSWSLLSNVPSTSPDSLATWASYQIHKIGGCACAGNARNDFFALDFKGNCMLEIPACITARSSSMWGLLTCGGGENVPSIPSACATCNFTYLARGPWGGRHRVHGKTARLCILST